MSLEDFAERRRYRGRETVVPDWVRFRNQEPGAHAYERHTVDIRGPAPHYVEDELLAFERGWKRAKAAWLVLGVLVAGYVVWRWFGMHGGAG